MSASIEQRNQDATCYTGNLDASVTETLLWEVSRSFSSNSNLLSIQTTKAAGIEVWFTASF